LFPSKRNSILNSQLWGELQRFFPRKGLQPAALSLCRVSPRLLFPILAFPLPDELVYSMPDFKEIV
jgi:hypothetical protein